MDVAVLLLHSNDVGGMSWFIPIDDVLVEGDEAKLEEVLDDDGDLEDKQSERQ